MRQKPQHLLIWVILIYVNVPGIAQIDPIKAAKDLGKSVPVKRDPAPRPTTAPSTSSSSPATTSSSTSSGTNTATALDATAESSPAKKFHRQLLESH
jgi:hypothetical protein